MNLRTHRFFGSFLLCILLFLCSGCGIVMGTAGALYYVKEEVIKPIPLAVVKLEIEEDEE